jgi:hypothetical protein
MGGGRDSTAEILRVDKLQLDTKRGILGAVNKLVAAVSTRDPND